MFPDKPNSFQSFSQAEKNAEKTEKESNELSRDRTHRLAVVAITLCVRDLCHIPKPHKNLFQWNGAILRTETGREQAVLTVLWKTVVRLLVEDQEEESPKGQTMDKEKQVFSY